MFKNIVVCNKKYINILFFIVIQSKIDEQNCEIKKLCIDKKTIEEDICKLRSRLCECRKESDQLNENIKALTEELKGAKTEINVQKLCVATMEENIKNDREAFTCELKNKCKKLKEMKTLYEETKCQLDEEMCKVKNLVSTLKDLNKSNEKNSCDLYKCLLESKTDRCAKENNICELENKIKELQQQNELKDIELRYNKNNCQSEQMKTFSEKLCKFKQKCASNHCQEKKVQKPVCCNVNTNCCNTQPSCCKMEKCCENLRTVTQVCCKNSNTKKCEQKCGEKCEEKCGKVQSSCHKTNTNDLVCKLNNLKKDIETLQMK